MIKTVKENGLFKTYSDSNLFIEKVATGEHYEVAYDVKKTEYIETEIPIPGKEENPHQTPFGLPKT